MLEYFCYLKLSHVIWWIIRTVFDMYLWLWIIAFKTKNGTKSLNFNQTRYIWSSSSKHVFGLARYEYLFLKQSNTHAQENKSRCWWFRSVRKRHDSIQKEHVLLLKLLNAGANTLQLFQDYYLDRDNLYTIYTLYTIYIHVVNDKTKGKQASAYRKIKIKSNQTGCDLKFY